MTTQPGAPGTAADGYKVAPEPGRHRAPPPVPTPRAPAAVAVAAAVLTAASLTAASLTAIAGQAVAPDGQVAASQVSTVARAEQTTAGPLEIPSIGASGAWSPPEDTTTENALSAPRSVPGVHGHAPATKTTAAGLSEVSSSAQEPTVTPGPQPVTDEPATTTRQRRHRTVPTPTTPLADPIAADTSATPTSEETPVETPTDSPVTVDVTGEVGTP